MRWDSRREDKGKHGKFHFLWQGPYVIYGYRGNNSFFIKNLDGTELQEGLVNGRMLTHYYSLESLTIRFIYFIIVNIHSQCVDWIGYFIYKVEA